MGSAVPRLTFIQNEKDFFNCTLSVHFYITNAQNAPSTWLIDTLHSNPFMCRKPANIRAKKLLTISNHVRLFFILSQNMCGTTCMPNDGKPNLF